MNLTKSSEKLDVYYSKVSSDGKSIRPSYLVQELQKMYPQIVTEDEEEKRLIGQELTETMGMEYLIRGFQNYDMDDLWCELYSWYKRLPKWQEKIERFLQAGYYKKPSDNLTKAVAEKLYGADFEKSITRMERFCVCAFAHFLTYGLGLRERQEYDFQALDLGNVCHLALERFGSKVEQSGNDWITVCRNICRASMLRKVWRKRSQIMVIRFFIVLRAMNI